MLARIPMQSDVLVMFRDARPTAKSNKAPYLARELATHAGSPVTRMTPERRKVRLSRVVAIQTAQGARVESRGDFEAVLARGLRLHNNHGLTITGGERRSTVTVDDYGNVTVRKL
jgi:hypothetical protein